MLSDDILGAASTGLRMVGSVLRGAFRGALVGAAFAIGGAALLVAGVCAVHAFAAAGLAAAAGAAIGGAVTGAAAMFGAGPLAGAAMGIGGLTFGTSLLATAAEVGALVIGVTSIIPGLGDIWNGTKNALMPKEKEVPVCVPCREPVRACAPEMENPYYVEGKGAKLVAAHKTEAAQAYYR